MQFNVFNTLCNQYRFDAVFIQKPIKAIISPFKGCKIEEFMEIHGNMLEQVQISSFLTIQNQAISAHPSTSPMSSKYSSLHG